MLTLAIDWPAILTGFLVLVFVCISVLMILTVLIQRPAGGGLSGAFGSGAGSGQTAFGTKTGDALTIATITMFVLFLLFAVVLNFMARPPSARVGQPSAAAAPPPATAPAGTTAPTESGTQGAPAPAPATQPQQEPPGAQPPPAEQPASAPGNPPA